MSKMREFVISYFNLLKTVIGSGMVNYPGIILRYGLIPTLFLMMFSAFFSVSGLLLYATSNKIVGKKQDMSSLARQINIKLEYVVNVFIALKCFAVGVLYMVIIKEIIPTLTKYIINKEISYLSRFLRYIENYLFLILFCITAPLSFYEKLHKLWFTSVLGLFSVFMMLISSTYSYANQDKSYEIKYISEEKNSYFRNLGEFVYGFTCHQNIFTIQNEMKNSNIMFLFSIVVSVMVSALSVYLYFGIINYKIYGMELNRGFLSLLKKDESFLTFFMLLLYCLMLFLSFPLQSNPCRSYSLNLFDSSYNNNRKLRLIFTIFLLAATFLSTMISTIDIKTCITYIGGSVSASICFIFCSIFYLKVGKNNPCMKFIAIITLIFGVFVSIGFIYDNICKLNHLLSKK